MICTESYFGVPNMHIAIVACKPPKPKVCLFFFILSFMFVLILKCLHFFIFGIFYCPSVLQKPFKNSAVCTSSSLSSSHPCFFLSQQPQPEQSQPRKQNILFLSLLCSETDWMYLKTRKESILLKTRPNFAPTPIQVRKNINKSTLSEFSKTKRN